MSRTVLALLLVLDVAATALVVAYLVRWWRSRSVEAGSSMDAVLEEMTEAYPVPQPRAAVSAAPTLTVLPTVPFVPPPRPQRQQRQGVSGGLGALYG